jgi:hypothetical protein
MKLVKKLEYMGFGCTDPNNVSGSNSGELLKTELSYITTEDCTTSPYQMPPSWITKNMYCVGGDVQGKATCKDGGGAGYDPVNDVVTGVVSFTSDTANFGNVGYPSASSRISAQATWIKETICTNSMYPPSWCECADSPYDFQVFIRGKLRFRSCHWAEKNATNRCKKNSVSKACPMTCNTCFNCSDTPTSFKVPKANGGFMKKDCSWATKDRCNKFDGLNDICRKTCGTC